MIHNRKEISAVCIENHNHADLDNACDATISLRTSLGSFNLTKRLFDIVFSLSVLVLGAPFFILIALLLFIPTKGRILFFHKRIGKNAKPFFCYKFRTMSLDADKKLAQLLESNSDIKEEWIRSFKLLNDPRVTNLGSFLRKTSLDELPQFFNVLKGEMSIVGPRPVTQEEIERYYKEKADKILSVAPGITGPWQTSEIRNGDYQARIQIDEQYINQNSFFEDLKIIFKTIPKVLFYRGA